MTRAIDIGGRQVGPGHPVLLIAEAGINHNGDLTMARELVRQAARAGADVVKFQTFRADALATPSAAKAPYQATSTGAGSQIDMLRLLELGADAQRELQRCCAEQGMLFMSTPYGFEDADFLETLDVPAFKLASAQLVEDPFLEHIAAKRRPLLLSTGMATLDEVQHAVDVLRQAGLTDLILLQCTTSYPTPIEEAHVRSMKTMETECQALIGYSDHTETMVAAVAAVALGACVIEKHFTLDRSLPGPDQSASFDPAQFKLYAEQVRAAERALGSPEKQPRASERMNITPMRRSVVAVQPIPRGTTITRAMLTLKRPATGLPARFLNQCVGRRAALDIAADIPLTEESIEWPR